jgi:SpoVK/Ycf46/Vps4 family AAA+-type ATPase
VKSVKKSIVKSNHRTELTSLELDCLETVAHQLLCHVLSGTDKGSLLGSKREVIDRLPGFDHADGIDKETATARLRARVSLVGRGRQLERRPLSVEKCIGTISRAILTGYCIQCRYKQRDRILRPYGLVVREPKIYLVAAEHAASEDTTEGSSHLKHFLCNRIENITLSEIPSRVPQSFSIDEYVRAGALEIPIQSLSSSLREPFELVLRLKQPASDNMLRDIEEFPLERSQAIIKSGINGDYLLKIPRQTANVALINWIFARQERIEVVEPLPLRQYVIAKLHATARSYLDGADSQFESGLSVTQSTDKKSVDPQPESSPRRSRYGLRSEENTVVRDMILTLMQSKAIDRSARETVRDTGLVDYLPADIRRLSVRGSLKDFSSAVKVTKTHPVHAARFEESDPFTANSDFIGQALNLSEIELGVFRLCLLINHHKPLQSALDHYYPDFTSVDIPSIINLLLSYPYDAIEHSLTEGQTLRKSGLVRSRTYGVFQVIDAIKIPTQLVADVFSQANKTGDLLRSFCEISPQTDIGAADLEHLSHPLSHIQQLIQGACQSREAGVNILLWGPPGTGKTQLARYVLQSLAINSFEVKTIGSTESPLEEAERVSSYNLCQTILGGGDATAIIFDEAENILKSLEYTSGDFSKAFINRLLENNPVPAIWISNKLGLADPAYLRRFAYVAEIPHLTIDVKRRIASRILHDIPLNGELLEDFLARQEIGPALFGKLKRVSEISEVTRPEDVDQLALSMVQGDLAALGAPPLVVSSIGVSSTSTELPYDPEMINPNIDLRHFSEKVKNSSDGRLLLFGPSGTGKTAWAKNLAATLGKPAHIVNPADIKDKYLGESEKAIVGAFSAAETDGAVLIFDEVDSFLRSRENFDRNHQADQVNQFLVSLENYKGLIVCSTNLIETIDQAALRRFDFKVKFQYLRSQQASKLFLKCAELLGMNLLEDEIEKIDAHVPDQALAPGDFAVALRQARLSADELTAEELYALLMAELEFRQGSAPVKIGFC